jgi:hypothetical protein
MKGEFCKQISGQKVVPNKRGERKERQPDVKMMKRSKRRQIMEQENTNYIKERSEYKIIVRKCSIFVFCFFPQTSSLLNITFLRNS